MLRHILRDVGENKAVKEYIREKLDTYVVLLFSRREAEFNSFNEFEKSFME